MPVPAPLRTLAALPRTARRRRRMLAAGLGIAMALGAGGTRAEDEAPYPNRLIRIIVPYTPGSIGDLFIRPIAQQMAQQLGQAVIIENKPGASQAIGGELAAQAAPNGYTLFMGTQGGFVLYRAARKTLPFNPEKDFAPITMLFTAPLYLFVSPSVPAQSVQELIALAKSRPNALTFASIGPGSSSHLAGEMFKRMAGIEMLHVPYRGGPEATTAVVTSQVDMMFNGGNALPQMARGKVRPLGIGALKRSTARPDLPTLDESGLAGYDISPWFGLFAPAGTPRPIIDKLNALVTRLLAAPETTQRAATLGVEVAPSTPDQLGDIVRTDYPVWTRIMREAGIEAE